MTVASITIPLMADLVKAVETLIDTVPDDTNYVSGRLNHVWVDTRSLHPAAGVVTFAQEEIPGLRRRLALARKIQASKPGISGAVTIDEDAISTKSPAQAKADAEKVAESLQDNVDDIPDDILELLESGVDDPYFAAALAKAMPPGKLADFLRDREVEYLNYKAANAGLTTDTEWFEHWADQQNRLTEALGTAYGVATTNTGDDLVLPASWRKEWFDQITSEDFDDRANPSMLTLLMRHGIWDKDIIVGTYEALEDLDLNGDYQHPYSGPEYWLERVGSSSSYEGATIPNSYGGYEAASDPFESLMFAVANNPEAGVELFASPTGSRTTLEVDGQDVEVDARLYAFLTERGWNDSDALAKALQASAMPREGGSGRSAFLAQDLGVIGLHLKELEDKAKAEEKPLWSKIVHGVLSVLGFVPVLGAIPDLVDAGIYVLEGDLTNAAISAGAAIPIAEYAVKGGKWVKVLRTVDRVEYDDLLRAGKIKDPTDLSNITDDVADSVEMTRFLGGVDIPADAVRISSGAKGAWNKALNKPLPNTTYVVDGKFVFKTDQHGRVIQADGHLDNILGGNRNTYQQRVAGRGDRLPGDQGGHIFGTWFGGPGEGVNLLAMSKTVNLSEYKKLEGTWAEAIAEGKKIDVNVVPVYKDGSLRPDSFKVSWKVDGVPQRPMTFHN